MAATSKIHIGVEGPTPLICNLAQAAYILSTPAALPSEIRNPGGRVPAINKRRDGVRWSLPRSAGFRH